MMKYFLYKLSMILIGILIISCNNDDIKQGNEIKTRDVGNSQQKSENIADSLSPQILRYDPKTTFAGQDFNLHDGKSVIWMEVKNLKKSVIVVWEGRQLPADKNPELTLLSFVVPKDLYSVPGSYEIYLLDVETGLKSKNVYFTVQ